MCPATLSQSSTSDRTWFKPRRESEPLGTQYLGTWNVEGLRGDSRIKLTEITRTMITQRIDILAIQETQLHDSEYFEHEGFMVCMSGEPDKEKRSVAGVGFLVAPWARSATVAFRAISSRLASLRVRV